MSHNFIGLILIISLAIFVQDLTPAVTEWMGGGELSRRDVNKAQAIGGRLALTDCPAAQNVQPAVNLAVSVNNDGYLRKIAVTHTNDLGAWALFLDGKVEGPFTFTVTAYNEHDGYTPGTITASGHPVMEGITAACGPEWELGTVIVLENGMIVRCLDRGGWITRGRLDIYFEELSEAERWGVQIWEGVVLKGGER